MKYVEFSGADMEDGDDVSLPNPNADVANKRHGQSLENLLVSKNRRLLDDLTKLRVSYEELSSSSARDAEALGQLEAELERIKQLNEKLEMDLMSLHNGEEPGAAKEKSATGLAGLDLGKSVRKMLGDSHEPGLMASGHRRRCQDRS